MIMLIPLKNTPRFCTLRQIVKCKLFILCLLFLTLAFTTPVCAKESFATRYNIAHITMENGLSHDFIDHIYKDSQGFLWISTGGGGLVRYDGYEFLTYNTSTNRVKLKSNFIREACEDDYNRLWVVSEGGIDILDLSSLRQTRPNDRSGILASLINQPATTVINDSKGCLWLHCGGAIHRLLFDPNGDIKQIHSLSTGVRATQSLKLHDVEEDGQIWVGIEHTAFKLYPSGNNKLQRVAAIPGLELESGTTISAFLMKENEIWIGTSKGLFRHYRNENITKQYSYEKNNPRSLSQDYITDLAITSDKQLLVSTLRGLNVYNPISGDFEQIRLHENEPDNAVLSLNSNFLNCMLIDHEMIWIGTETGGINKFTPCRLSFRSYVYNKNNPFSISQNPVNAVYEDNKGTLWVGTVEGGLNRKLKGSDSFTHYTSDAPSFISHNSVSALTTDANGRLWIGTWGDGITLLDLNHPDRRAIKYISATTNPEFTIDFIGSICYDPINKGIWIGANPGIYFYDLVADHMFSPFPNPDAANVYGVIGTLIDTKGRLWMGSMEGLYIIDLHSRTSDNTFSYQHLRKKLDEPESHLSERISCCYQTNDGTVWIGSNGYGIYKYIEEDSRPHFVSFTTEHGLINNNVRGILEDNTGRLWVSTNNGLSCFDTMTNSFINYTKDDGLPANQFYWNAHCRSKNGTLYFGSLNGLVEIEAKRRQTPPSPSEVKLTKLLIMNNEVFPDGKHIDTNIAMAKWLKLHERDKSFSIEFSALNYNSQSAATYRYRLLGFDDKWIETPSNRRFASYTNLRHGKYTFQVMYLPEGKAVGIPVTELEVIISPFFYKRPWFILLLIFAVTGGTLYLYHRRIRTLKQQRELLHRTVQERTQELACRNEMLTQQNEKITKQKTQLVNMSKKVQELTVDKLSFFTNITHEFRTPITLIIGPIERALKLSYNPQVIEQLNFVDRNSKYLLSLVNQLMDFRKIESGKMEINKTKSDFLKFIDSIVLPFAVFAEERDITIRKYYRLNDPDLLFDQDAMQKVITNLLSNAVKFTPDGGIVSIYVSTLTGKEPEKLYIGIKDTGKGIAEEDLPKIFNRFYQSADHVKFPVYGQSGTGIGLYLSKRIIQMHEGTIEVRNNRVKGASFCISLPLSREDGTAVESRMIPHLSTLQESPDFVPSHFSPNRLTMLVVEDNKDMRGYIRSILSEQYNILEAENGAEALTVLSTCNVDFIISDLMMPVMDGIELSRKIKENFAISHIPFLMLTAKTSQESRLESYRMGVDEYLMKPFNEELLLTRIANILENRKRHQHQFALKMDVDALNIVEESSDKKFLNKAMDIIKSNYMNPAYEVTDFIEAMGVSKSLLNKKMQTLTGQSIGQFIRYYRLNIARELIERNKITRNLNISEIAYEVGFNDPKYFSRCFTKRFNIPPSSLLEE